MSVNNPIKDRITYTVEGHVPKSYVGIFTNEYNSNNYLTKKVYKTNLPADILFTDILGDYTMEITHNQ